MLLKKNNQTNKQTNKQEDPTEKKKSRNTKRQRIEKRKNREKERKDVRKTTTNERVRPWVSGKVLCFYLKYIFHLHEVLFFRLVAFSFTLEVLFFPLILCNIYHSIHDCLSSTEFFNSVDWALDTFQLFFLVCVG